MKNKARILISTLTVLTMLFTLITPGYAGSKDALRISVGGQMLDQAAVESNDTIFLPLRSVCESFGYTVEWSKENNSVTVKNKDKTILFEPKAGTVTDAGHSYFENEGHLAANYIGGSCILFNSRIYTAAETLETCLGIKDTYDQAGNRLELSPASEGNVKVENKKIFSEDSKLKTNIQYPYITAADQAVTDKINAVILANVETAQKEGKDNIKNYGSYESPNKYETYFNYKIRYQQDGLLSLVLFDYQYYGGAHGTTIQITHTFDLKTGTDYSLADLMKSNSGYVDYINRSIKADILKEGLKDAQIVEFVSISDHQSYYLSNRGLVIYFQQYEYFPYAAGIMEYDFPYDDLADCLKPEFQFLCTAN